MTDTNGAKQKLCGVAVWCFLLRRSAVVFGRTGASVLLKASVSSFSAWSAAENEVVLKSWSLTPHCGSQGGAVLTLGWFAKPMRPGAVGALGVARGARRWSDPAKCQTDLLLAITWPCVSDA